MSTIFQRVAWVLLIFATCAAGQTAPDVATLTAQHIAALKAKARAGNADAENCLGDLYQKGANGPCRGASGVYNSPDFYNLVSLVPLDYARAAYWYRRAATQGNIDAEKNLAYLYIIGYGVPQDSTKAAAWYRKAAEQGDAFAQDQLGDDYALGNGVPVDYVQAAAWLRKAAEQGDASAQANLAHLYEVGYGVPQDSTQVAMWYRKAADQGNEYAQKRLAAIQATEVKGPNQVPVLSGTDVARMAFKSVVLLEMNDANGQPLSLGSGFFIADGVIATNAHVIEGAASGTANIVGSKQKLQITGVVAINRHADLALLKVDGSAPALNLGPDAKPAVGDKVYVVGNPLGLEGTFSEGIISGLRTVDADSILQMTAPISPGSSGGPVMDTSGAVIGVAVATFSDGQNLNLAVPVSYLSTLWTSTAKPFVISPLLSLADGGKAQVSIVDGLGERAESGVIASNFQLYATGEMYSKTPEGYSLRLTNKLPVDVKDIDWRVIYYDASGAVMDFESYYYPDAIPSGLTKTVVVEGTAEATRAAAYYATHWEASPTPKAMEPRVEIRIVSFRTEGSRY